MNLQDDASLVSAIAASQLICKKCQHNFVPASLDEASRGTCTTCITPGSWPASRTQRSTALDGNPRPFTPADKALIGRLHGYMPASQLLEVLNHRLQADMGAEAPPYTPQQLHAAVQAVQAMTPASSGWSSVRKQLAEARREGVLQHVNEQVIDDFAVVFSLTAKQVLHLKDIVLTGSSR